MAQLANSLAVRLDRSGKAKMSCIAGVGGGVPFFVKQARSSPVILCLDGCPHQCAATCLKNAGVAPSHHLVLTEMGFKKADTGTVSENEVEELMADIQRILTPYGP